MLRSSQVTDLLGSKHLVPSHPILRSSCSHLSICIVLGHSSMFSSSVDSSLPLGAFSDPLTPNFTGQVGPLFCPFTFHNHCPCHTLIFCSFLKITWSTERSRAKANRVLPRECTGHSKHPLPTPSSREDSTHGHHQMVDTKIRLIIFFVAKDGEALYSQQKKTRS